LAIKKVLGRDELKTPTWSQIAAQQLGWKVIPIPRDVLQRGVPARKRRELMELRIEASKRLRRTQNPRERERIRRWYAERYPEIVGRDAPRGLAFADIAERPFLLSYEELAELASSLGGGEPR